MRRFSFFIYLLVFALSCKQVPKTHDSIAKNIPVPVFNADSAYSYTAKQVSFGPRVPGTEAHKACGNYLSGELKRFGAEVTEQEATLYLKDGTPVRIKNIIGSFQPQNKSRILLFAHWDSRPFACQDPNPDNWMKPIDGANDGAGACAALLEIARHIGISPPAVGVDIIFFDMEDWGPPDDISLYNNHYGKFCMGSEYWARNPHIPNYTARYGILLDMVSAPGAQFFREILSQQVAPAIVKKVWEAARATGYGSFFVDKDGGDITDDHVPVIKYRKIPSINIVHYIPGASGFGSYWHTLDDNMENVSKETLRAVGQTVLYVLYKEK